MLRRLLQPFWVLLAIIFLIEAWLWDHLEPVVARLVAWIPLRQFKQWLSDRVDALSPAMTLIVFAVPVIPLFPLKLLGLWLLAHEYWLAAVFDHPVREIRRRRHHRLHLRCDAGEASGDALVREDLRLHPMIRAKAKPWSTDKARIRDIIARRDDG